MFLAFVFAKRQLDKLNKDLASLSLRILNVEDATQHPVVSNKIDPAEQQRPAEPADYGTLTVELGRMNYQIAAQQIYTVSLQELCELALESMEPTTAAEKQRRSFRQSQRILTERLDCINRSARHAHMKFQMLEKRAQSQVSIVSLL